MILDFSVKNFRSIKNRQTFSMVAEPSKIKGDNVFEVSLPKGDSVRLLKSAVIYGANTSGKSNLIKALGSFIQLINRRIAGAGRSVRGYDPFLFASETITEPSFFELSFVFENVKYKYKVGFNLSHILEEELVYFPKGQSNRIFERLGGSDDLLHKIRLGKDFGNKEIDVFSNQLGMNKFGTDTPHELLTKVYVYFDSIEINNAVNRASEKMQIRRISQRFSQPENHIFLTRLKKLIRVADTKITSLDVLSVEEPVPRLIRNATTGTFDSKVKNRSSKQIYGVHQFYDHGVAVDTKILDFEEESDGTKSLLWRGGLILETLEKGGVLVFDELDNSLHPKLVKFLVKLFSHPLSNPNNAQLIFATHEVTLLDRDLFRTDQIWFAEKNQFGETEIFSAQDFEGVREDVPFDKWYMAGKFGGLPKIEDIESIFNHE